MTFGDYDFTKHQGITPSADRALHKRFKAWAEIAASLPEQLLEVRGISADIALDLLDTAKQQIRAEAARQPIGEKVEDVDREARYILTSKPADYRGPDGIGRVTNIKRRRNLLTPAVCDRCGRDFVDERGLGDYADLSPATQDQLRRHVAEHKAQVHTLATEMVVTESQLKALSGDPDPDRKKGRSRPRPQPQAPLDAAA